MTLSEQLCCAARACEGAANALAYALRPASTPTSQSSALQQDTCREAEAFAITCRAVMDEMNPVLPLLESDSACIGKQRGLVHESSRVCNGFDTLALILLTLFDASNNAILDTASVRSRSLLSPLNPATCFEKMVTHHGQLRAMYGIIHLVGRIIRHIDVSTTLFLTVPHGSEADRDFQPASVRAAIKLDDFYGRGFGFHYSPEMRNVLRVVNIARGSVHKSHVEDDPSPQFIKNVFMLGWGWVYSNMVLIDNLGFSIEGVSRIGADQTRMTIGTLRKFMNLVEEPLVAGVTSFVSADVAVDVLFDIPPPGDHGGLEPVDSPCHSEGLREVLKTVCWAVRARLMSHKNRPINLNKKDWEKHQQNKPIRPAGPSNSQPDSEQLPKSNENDDMTELFAPMPSPTKSGKEQNVAHTVPKRTASRHGTRAQPFGVTSTSWNDVVDKSYLATAFKSGVTTFQSNVSSFLGLEETKPASGLTIHFHGGGFVSQSTASHQAYMKEICADIQDSVMFSVDYKLAPENKFPVALHECMYAYIWALQNAHRLGTLAKRVVFVGDSAGGNLAVALALLAGQLGLRPPDAICVAYPALYIKVAWSPSRLLSFFDPLLPLSVLELCLKSYVENEDHGDRNPLLSPVVAADDQLQALPPVALICGSLDPLLDDSVLFASRLTGAGRTGDCLKVYESMPHGFLNMIQVNITARKALHFLTTKIADGLQVSLRRRGMGLPV